MFGSASPNFIGLELSCQIHQCPRECVELSCSCIARRNARAKLFRERFARGNACVQPFHARVARRNTRVKLIHAPFKALFARCTSSFGLPNRSGNRLNTDLIWRRRGWAFRRRFFACGGLRYTGTRQNADCGPNTTTITASVFRRSGEAHPVCVYPQKTPLNQPNLQNNSIVSNQVQRPLNFNNH
jgi:hypothetical protein